MIVSCPECSSKFRIAPEALGASGRKVRCSSCRHTWFQEPELEFTPTDADIPAEDNDVSSDVEDVVASSESAPPPIPPEPSPLDDDFVEPGNVRSKRPKGFAPDKKKKGKGGLIAWLLLLILGGGAGYAVADQSARIQIVNTVPEAMKVYDFLDLQVYPVGYGLEIENKDPERGVRDGVKVVTLAGKIHNKLDKKVVVPKLIGWLSDNRGAAVSRKTVTLDVPYLDPKEEVDFLIELEISPKAVGVNTSFISDDDALQNPDFDPVGE
ncbi:zinc-ribbon domain-containing protein [Kiloniella sp. EL199]|uniref:zinc-ribbon domain-containing protein n=1 Tax=Kiloniella sp. EL199 TaxID=2107581 RepID=UPI000EA321CA|nr:zinc-ribbon domain-containing protein [Kiloniella sp. EL199]